MIPVIEFQNRSLIGPVMREQDFDVAVSRKVREIVARYNIKFNPEEIIVDDVLADSVFEGGVDLLAEVGLYNKDTFRIIKLSKEEIKQIAKETQTSGGKETLGSGRDKVTVHTRVCGDKQRPVFLSNMFISAEDLLMPYLLSEAQEELMQGFMAGGIATVGGITPRIGTPSEVESEIVDVRGRIEAARRVGKPNMFIGTSGGVSPGAIMACYFPGGLGKHNSVISLHIMPELKLNWSRLVLASCALNGGIKRYASATSIVGALCRGPEESAVAIVANLLGQLAYSQASIATVAPSDVNGGRSTREVMWTFSASARASERHIGVPLGTSTQSEAGACTEMAFYEKAAQTIAHIGSGAAYTRGQACRLGKGLNHSSGLEFRLVAETALAVVGLSRAAANKLVNQALTTYESQIGKAPRGKSFSECYDLKTITPLPEYLAVYERAKTKLAQCGITYYLNKR